jgi:hypothetical protein
VRCYPVNINPNRPEVSSPSSSDIRGLRRSAHNEILAPPLRGYPLVRLGACPSNGASRAQRACEAQARREEEVDAGPSSTTSKDACARYTPAPGGLRRRGAICGVAAPRRWDRIAFVAAPCIWPRGARNATAPAYSDRLLARIIHEASSASADLGGLARVRERRRTVANRITQPPPFPRVFLPSPCSPRLAPALPPRGLGVRTLRRIVEDTTRVLTPTCAHHTGHLCALATNPHE